MGNFSQKVDKFIDIFLNQNGYVKVVQGLHNTLLIAICGLIIGIVIGTLIATVRVIPKYKTLPRVLNHICSFYVALFRGTPMVVQLLIFYYVLLPIFGVKITGVQVSMVVFGLNSGAYISEIMRSGIQSVDPGQMEAGRSLGLNKFQTMRYIIIPQAFKSILPPLGNEFIVLIKETSIVGYVGMSDLTRVANQMTSKLFDVFTPLLGIAFIYFVLTKVLSILLAKLERRLRKSDNR